MVKRKKNFKKLFNIHSRRLWLLIIAVLLVGLLLDLRGFRKTTSTIPSTNPSSNSNAANRSPVNQQKTGSSTPTGSTTGTSSADKDKASAPASSGTLITPYGVFVSNHTPGQNDSHTTETSTCVTTPGATCHIEFTKGGETKLLQATTTDSSGTAYWNWDVSNPKLSAGDWTITAVATLNGASKSAQDSRALTVQ
jgi:hypothetical protein